MNLLQYANRVVTTHIPADLDQIADRVQIPVSAFPQIEDLIGGRGFGGKVRQVTIHAQMCGQHSPVVTLLGRRIQTLAQLLFHQFAQPEFVRVDDVVFAVGRIRAHAANGHRFKGT